MTERIRRQWRWYSPRDDDPVTMRELKGLAPHGQLELIKAMRLYERGEERRDMVTKIRKDIYELRVRIGTDPFRILFFHDTPVHVVVLRAFYKNQQKLPKEELEVALQRRRHWKETHEADMKKRDSTPKT